MVRTEKSGIAPDYACLVAQSLKGRNGGMEAKGKGKGFSWLIREGCVQDIQERAAQSVIECVASGKKRYMGSPGCQFHGLQQGLAWRRQQIVAGDICVAQSAQKFIRGKDVIELLTGVKHMGRRLRAAGVDVQGASGGVGKGG